MIYGEQRRDVVQNFLSKMLDNMLFHYLQRTYYRKNLYLCKGKASKPAIGKVDNKNNAVEKEN